MARNYKVLATRPHPNNPLNISTVVEINDAETGEKLTLSDVIFGSDLTAHALAKQLGLIEQNVMVPRSIAMAQLKSLVESGGEIEPILPIQPDPKQAGYQQAINELLEKDRLVALKVIEVTDQEYIDAVEAAKTAKNAIESKAK